MVQRANRTGGHRADLAMDALSAATVVYKYSVYLLPKQLDEKVAGLHFPAFGAALTVFAQEHPSAFLPDVVVFHEPVLCSLIS